MNKKRKIAIIVSVVILLVVSLTLTLTSCAQEGYKLTFDVDGAVVKTIDIPSVGTPELPDTPVKSGYTFEGWYFDKETLSDPCTAETIANKQFTADTVAYSKWLKNDYTIEYKLDGGINGANPSGYAVDTATIKLADPSKIGYTFDGWYSEDTFATKVTEIATGSTGNKTLYAKWTAVIYTIKYVTNCETTVADTTYDMLTMPKSFTTLTREGYVFEGWYDNDDTERNVVTAITKDNIGSKILVAKWTKNDYTITYNLDGGTNVVANPSGYAIDTAAITLAAPTKLGYTFGGWFEDDKFTKVITEIATGSIGDKTLFAKWTKNDYTITYNLYGGINGANPSGYAADMATITLAAPTKVGYTFGGWFEDNEFTKVITEIAAGSTGNKTLFAKWTAIEYDIIYELKGGVQPASYPKTYNIETGATLTTPTKLGYTFGGWIEDDKFTKVITEIAAGSTENKTLFAKWTKDTYTITYELNGGKELTANPTTYAVDTSTITLAAPTKTGYTFGGWYSEDTFTTKVTEIAKGSTGNKTLFAKWTAIEYDIIYELKGGVQPASYPKTYNIETGATLTTPTKLGYTLAGWYDNAEFKGNAITAITKGSTGNKTLYAKWTALEYKITYNLNEGVLTGTYPKTYNIETGATLATPTKLGYTFGGWYDNTGFNGSDITAITKGSTGNKTLFAKWMLDTYTITYVCVDGVGATNPNKVATYNINTPTITIAAANWKEGATFVGWSIDGNVTTATMTRTIDQGSTGDITYTAHWTFTDYTITYNLDRGTNSLDNPSKYTIATPTIKFEAPTKRGYTFIGWFTNATGGSKVEQITSGSTGAVNVYANWEITTYTITYAGLDGVFANKPTNANNTATTYKIDSEPITIQSPDWGTVATFDGWSIDGNVTHVVKSPTIEKNSIGDITFTAHWTFTQYAITYDHDGGTNWGGNPSSYNIDTATITLLAPAHSDSVDSFDGWFDAAIGGNQVTTIDRGSTGAMTLYAHWTYTATAGLTYNIINGNEYEVTCATPSDVVVIPRRHDNKLVTKIAANAFLSKTSIMSVSIPSSVKSIGDNAFKSCSAIASLNLPDGLTSIGTGAFESCGTLNSINIPDGVTSILAKTFKGCAALLSMKIPEGVASIGVDAFYGCAALESVNIPSAVKIIENFVFRGCKALKSVTISTNVESIGEQAFASCTSLTSVTIPGNVRSVGKLAFANCTSLIRVSILDGVASIGDNAFVKCPIVSIFIPNSVVTMGGTVFKDCTELTISCERAETPLPTGWNDTWMGNVTNISWSKTRPAVTP